MSDEIYRKLATVLDTLPNGFPTMDNQLEIKLLKRIFEPDQAELFCDLRLAFETAEQIAERTGRPLEGLEEKLITMTDRGQLFGVELEGTWLFKMVPWAFGIYEFQLPHLDRELAEMTEEYHKAFGQQFFSKTPQMMQTLPIEEEIPSEQEALPYEKVSALIEGGESFLLNECVCKKEHALLDRTCDRPLEVCMAIAPIPGAFDNPRHGRIITKEEAYKLLAECEENGLVHLTGNTQNDRFYICNCCKCCCGVLRGINELGILGTTVVNSSYFAEVDLDECNSCGVCAEERCQVGAIDEKDDYYEIGPERCIGCGLCISTCPTDAIKLRRRPESEVAPPPVDQEQWYRERGQRRGVDFSKYE
jgi:NAD-dependent dihydropyrimidine dehydrogenase PreA subunit